MQLEDSAGSGCIQLDCTKKLCTIGFGFFVVDRILFLTMIKALFRGGESLLVMRTVVLDQASHPMGSIPHRVRLRAFRIRRVCENIPYHTPHSLLTFATLGLL